MSFKYGFMMYVYAVGLNLIIIFSISCQYSFTLLSENMQFYEKFSRDKILPIDQNADYIMNISLNTLNKIEFKNSMTLFRVWQKRNLKKV